MLFSFLQSLNTVSFKDSSFVTFCHSIWGKARELAGLLQKHKPRHFLLSFLGRREVKPDCRLGGAAPLRVVPTARWVPHQLSVPTEEKLIRLATPGPGRWGQGSRTGRSGWSPCGLLSACRNLSLNCSSSGTWGRNCWTS